MFRYVLQIKNSKLDEYFHIQKQEYLYQISQQIILTSAKGFFIINRKFLAGVSNNIYFKIFNEYIFNSIILFSF